MEYMSKLMAFEPFIRSMVNVQNDRLEVSLNANVNKGDGEARLSVPRGGKHPLTSFKVVSGVVTTVPKVSINSLHLMDQYDQLPHIVWMKLEIIYQYFVGNSLLMRSDNAEAHFGDTMTEFEREMYSKYIARFMSSYGLFFDDQTEWHKKTGNPEETIMEKDPDYIVMGQRVILFNNHFIHSVEHTINRILKNSNKDALKRLEVSRNAKFSHSYDYYMSSLWKTVTVNSLRDILERMNESNNSIVHTLTQNTSYTLELDKELLSLYAKFEYVFAGVKAMGASFSMKYTLDKSPKKLRGSMNVKSGLGNLVSFIERVNISEYVGSFLETDTTAVALNETQSGGLLSGLSSAVYAASGLAGSALSVPYDTLRAVGRIPGSIFYVYRDNANNAKQFEKVQGDITATVREETSLNVPQVESIESGTVKKPSMGKEDALLFNHLVTVAGGGDKEVTKIFVTKEQDYGEIEVPMFSDKLECETFLMAIVHGESLSVPTTFIEDGVSFTFVPTSSSLINYFNTGYADYVLENDVGKESIETAFSDASARHQNMGAILPTLIEAFSKPETKVVSLSCVGLLFRGQKHAELVGECNQEYVNTHWISLKESFIDVFKCESGSVSRRQRRTFLDKERKTKLGVEAFMQPKDKHVPLPGIPVKELTDVEWSAIDETNTWKSFSHAAHVYEAAVIADNNPTIVRNEIFVTDISEIKKKLYETGFNASKYGMIDSGEGWGAIVDGIVEGTEERSFATSFLINPFESSILVKFLVS